MAPVSGFFQSNIILIFFVYGLAFFLMGLVIAIESRRTSALPLARSLWLLGIFGLLNGVVGWIDMFMSIQRPTPGPPTPLLFHEIQPLNCFQCHQRLVFTQTLGWDGNTALELVKVLFLVASPLFLLHFGAKLLRDTWGGAAWLTWGPVSLLGVWVVGILLGQGLAGEGVQEWLITGGILARYLLYVPASVLAAAAFVTQRPVFRQMQLPRIARESLWAALVFGVIGLLDGLVVPPAPFFPASWLNYASFFALSGIPVQAFRALSALALAYFVVRILRIFEIEYQRRLSRANEERFQAQQEALAAQQRAKAQLEEWGRELEQRVLQRTKEVEQRNREVAILEERDRIAAEMHDTLGQVLGYLNLKVLTTEQALSAGKTHQALEELKAVEKAVAAACADVRESILSLRTTVTPEKGLVATLADFLDRYSEQTGLKVEVSTGGLDHIRFPMETEVQLLRIIQESLTNVRRHAQATRAWLQIREGRQGISFTVGDDGQGFDPKSIQKDPGQRFGLQIMRERAENIGGHLVVASRPGQGTRVIIRLPRTALEGEGDGTYQRARGG